MCQIKVKLCHYERVPLIVMNTFLVSTVSGSLSHLS